MDYWITLHIPMYHYDGSSNDIALPLHRKKMKERKLHSDTLIKVQRLTVAAVVTFEHYRLFTVRLCDNKLQLL